MGFTLPEHFKIVMIAPTAAGNAVAYDRLSCKDAIKVWFLVTHVGTSDTDLTLSLVEATAVSGGSTTAVTATFPIWKDPNAGTASDTLVRQTDAASHQINTGAAGNPDQLVIIEWDPAKFSAGYDCIVLTDANGDAGNNVTAVAIIETRHPGASIPSAIIN